MMQPNFKLTTATESDNTAVIHIEPLEKGFGHTMGNSLRRVMLTALPGAAATHVSIDGVSHQFTTLDGLQENIIEFIMGLKKVAFKMEGDEPVVVKINQKGKKEITAADLECPAGVTVTNKETHLGSLTSDKSKLKAEITVSKGVGYVPAEEHATNEIGVIPLDSIFTPVLSAHYTVEATRVGRRTDLDKIVMNVVTNGTTTPQTAIEDAGRILASYFTQLYDPQDVDESMGASVSASIDAGVEELDLPTRLTNALKKGGFKRISDFAKASRSDLLKVKNLGEKSIDEIINLLAQKGVKIS